MPRPQFIICSQSTAIDQDSNSLSIFNVMEGISIHLGNEHPQQAEDFKPGNVLNTLNFRVVAVWMREENDSPKDEYDYEFYIHPPGEAEKEMSKGTFHFTSVFQRFQMHVFRDRPWQASGMLKVICKIRKRATEANKKHPQQTYQQEYAFPVTVNDHRKEPNPELN